MICCIEVDVYSEGYRFRFQDLSGGLRPLDRFILGLVDVNVQYFNGLSAIQGGEQDIGVSTGNRDVRWTAEEDQRYIQSTNNELAIIRHERRKGNYSETGQS